MTRFLKTILLLIVVLNVSAQDRKFQIWNQNNFDVFLSEKTSIGISEKVHYAPRYNSIDVKFADITLDHKFTSWFEIGGGGRLLAIKKEYGWLQEKRPMLYADLSIGLGIFKIDFGNRIEYRFLDKSENHWRHKQKLSLNFPKIPQTALQFYTAFESFYKFNPDGFHIFRGYAGINTIQKEHFKLKVYYVLEKNKNAVSFTIIDILGIDMSVEF
ncbi:MAG TPA: DUF2490 domain-containing protein [Tangfeifania sp.]|nr:DUF2490 domain-containing protein [Tangfeifania sp.]